MIFRTCLLITLGSLAVIKGQAQQNMQFSQYIFNGLSLNPAYAGYKEEWYLHMMYRAQWVGLSGAPRTGTLSADGLTTQWGKKVGLGLQLATDRLGPQEALSGYGFYAYRLRLDEEDTKRLSLGLGWGFTQYSIDTDAIIVNDPDDPELPGKNTTMIPDLRFGIYYSAPRFFASVSVMDMFAEFTGHRTYNMNGYNYEVMRKSRHMYFSAGTLLRLSENLHLKPSFLMKEDFKGPTNLDLNATLLIKDFLWIGGAYRTGVDIWKKSHLPDNLKEADAISGIVEFFAGERFRVGYAFDYSLTDLHNYESGSHEVSVGYIFPTVENKKEGRGPKPF